MLLILLPPNVFVTFSRNLKFKKITTALKLQHPLKGISPKTRIYQEIASVQRNQTPELRADDDISHKHFLRMFVLPLENKVYVFLKTWELLYMHYAIQISILFQTTYLPLNSTAFHNSTPLGCCFFCFFYLLAVLLDDNYLNISTSKELF